MNQDKDLRRPRLNYTYFFLLKTNIVKENKYINRPRY